MKKNHDVSENPTLLFAEKEQARSRPAAGRPDRDGGIYYGPAMREVLELAGKAAPTAAPVLILGETGTGKEELARRVHELSGREGPFVAINPATIPEQLFESELFGHEKGAFTGAHQQQTGLLKVADKGTLFIDEIGDIPLSLQVKLLRVLQDGIFTRLGGASRIHSDFRLISATHDKLGEKIRTGTFREDFYYRIAVIPLSLPPLRERPGDIRYLAEMFIGHFSALYTKPPPVLTEEELEGICARPWPGNVRELRSFIERAVILHGPGSGRFILEPPAEFSVPPAAAAASPAVLRPGAPDTAFHCDTIVPLEELEKRYIRHVLDFTLGKVGGEGGARELLNVKLSTLYKKMKRYGLDKTTLIYGKRKRQS